MTNKELEKLVGELGSQVTTLSEKINKLFLVPGTKQTFSVSTPVESLSLSDKAIKELGQSEPVLAEYREIVDTVLNKTFGVHSKLSGDGTGFVFSILVPEKYSSLTPAQKAMNMMDIRSRVIEHHLKEAGVREWVETVFKNFNPDIQALITADRISLSTS